jgi:hypothetical protein
VNNLKVTIGLKRKANYPRSEAERDTEQAKQCGVYILDLLKYIQK